MATQSPPASDERLVFVNIGWMVAYQGPTNDPTLGGHGWLRTHDLGHEAWNFEPVNGRLYGYVPRSARIQLWRLGARRSAESVSGVTVVWIARCPINHQTYVVGWYRNATIQRDNRHYRISRNSELSIEYQIEGPAEQAKLLPPDQRVLLVPTAKVPGNMGQSPVWYGNEEFRELARRYLANDGVDVAPPIMTSGGRPHQPDAATRQRVELIAVQHAIAHYRSPAGGSRTVESVEADNVGWDLNVIGGGMTLKVEVKGLSGSTVCVELTPNEYSQMLAPQNRSSYVVYVVCDALNDRPTAHVFYYNADASKKRSHVWSTSEGRLLKIEPITAARLSAAS